MCGAEMSRRSNVRRSNVGAQMWALKGRVTNKNIFDYGN
jgi:hypothetical protein